MKKSNSTYQSSESFEEFCEINEEALYGVYTGEIYGASNNIEERDFELFQEREFERTQGKSAHQ